MASILQLVIFNNTQSCLQSVDFCSPMPKERVCRVGDRKEDQGRAARRADAFSVGFPMGRAILGGRQLPLGLFQLHAETPGTAAQVHPVSGHLAAGRILTIAYRTFVGSSSLLEEELVSDLFHVPQSFFCPCPLHFWWAKFVYKCHL